MNVANFLKYFSDHTVETSGTVKDKYGASIASTVFSTVSGYVSKSASKSDSGDIPKAIASAIFFTLPDVILRVGDILDDRYVIADYDKHHSHIEYMLSYHGQAGQEVVGDGY